MATRATHSATLALVPVANTATLRATHAATQALVPVANTATLRATHAVTLALVPVPPVTNKPRASAWILN